MFQHCRIFALHTHVLQHYVLMLPLTEKSCSFNFAKKQGSILCIEGMENKMMYVKVGVLGLLE